MSQSRKNEGLGHKIDKILRWYDRLVKICAIIPHSLTNIVSLVATMGRPHYLSTSEEDIIDQDIREHDIQDQDIREQEVQDSRLIQRCIPMVILRRAGAMEGRVKLRFKKILLSFGRNIQYDSRMLFMSYLDLRYGRAHLTQYAFAAWLRQIYNRRVTMPHSEVILGDPS